MFMKIKEVIYLPPLSGIYIYGWMYIRILKGPFKRTTQNRQTSMNRIVN